MPTTALRQEQNFDALLTFLHFHEFAGEVISPLVGPRLRRQLSPEQRRAIYDHWGGTDWYTGRPIAFADMDLDHLIPHSRGDPMRSRT